MDWIWRILLSLFAVNLIVNAKYFPIWDDLALVTLILQASIITFGTLPFLIKILNALMGLGKKSSKSKKPSTADILKESEADDRARSAHLQPPADSTPQDQADEMINVYPPDHFDYSKGCLLHWHAKADEPIKKGAVIFEIVEFGANNQRRSFEYKAKENATLISKESSVSDGSKLVVDRADTVVCTLKQQTARKATRVAAMVAAGTAPVTNGHLNGNAHHAAAATKETVIRKLSKSQLQKKLSDLKDLKEQSLISDTIWQEKQKELMDHF